jgi:hypothetical protein
MKLYYVIDKWKVDKTDIIIPFYYIGDCSDTEYYEHIELNVFTEDQLFEKDLLEKYDEKITTGKHKGRIFSIYSIDTENIPENFVVEKCIFYYKLSVKNLETDWIEHNEIYSYNSNYHSLKWQLEQHIHLNTDVFKKSLEFIDNPERDIKLLINIICGGDDPDRLVRLNILQKSRNENKNFESAKELYKILFDFTFGDYYDMNAEGYAYYRAMRYLRDVYNVDPERSKHDEPN